MYAHTVRTGVCERDKELHLLKSDVVGSSGVHGQWDAEEMKEVETILQTCISGPILWRRVTFDWRKK